MKWTDTSDVRLAKAIRLLTWGLVACFLSVRVDQSLLQQFQQRLVAAVDGTHTHTTQICKGRDNVDHVVQEQWEHFLSKAPIPDSGDSEQYVKWGEETLNFCVPLPEGKHPDEEEQWMSMEGAVDELLERLEEEEGECVIDLGSP